MAVLLVVLPPDGIERTEWMQFIGRFHPLAVHFPIALILLVPVLELAGLTYRFTIFTCQPASCSALRHLLQRWRRFWDGFSRAAAVIPGPCDPAHVGWGVPGGSLLVCWILRASVTATRGTGFLYAVCLRGALVW